MLAVTVSLPGIAPEPLPTHRLVWGALLATAVFVVATAGLWVYLQYITRTGYTYGALATPIAFLLFAFFLGFAIAMGAELNAAIQEGGPHRHRTWHQWRARWRGDESIPVGGTLPNVRAGQRRPPHVTAAGGQPFLRVS